MIKFCQYNNRVTILLYQGEDSSTGFDGAFYHRCGEINGAVNRTAAQSIFDPKDFSYFLFSDNKVFVITNIKEAQSSDNIGLGTGLVNHGLKGAAGHLNNDQELVTG